MNSVVVSFSAPSFSGTSLTGGSQGAALPRHGPQDLQSFLEIFGRQTTRIPDGGVAFPPHNSSITPHEDETSNLLSKRFTAFQNASALSREEEFNRFRPWSGVYQQIAGAEQDGRYLTDHLGGVLSAPERAFSLTHFPDGEFISGDERGEVRQVGEPVERTSPFPPFVEELRPSGVPLGGLFAASTGRAASELGVNTAKNPLSGGTSENHGDQAVLTGLVQRGAVWEGEKSVNGQDRPIASLHVSENEADLQAEKKFSGLGRLELPEAKIGGELGTQSNHGLRSGGVGAEDERGTGHEPVQRAVSNRDVSQIIRLLNGLDTGSVHPESGGPGTIQRGSGGVEAGLSPLFRSAGSWEAQGGKQVVNPESSEGGIQSPLSEGSGGSGVHGGMPGFSDSQSGLQSFFTNSPQTAGRMLGPEDVVQEFPAPSLQRMQVDVQVSESQRVQIDVGVQHRQVYAGLMVDQTALRNLALQYVPHLEEQLMNADMELNQFTAETFEGTDHDAQSTPEHQRAFPEHQVGRVGVHGQKDEPMPPVMPSEETGWHLVA